VDGILVLFWALTLGIVFCGLVGAAYYAYVRTTNRAETLAKILAAFAVFGLTTAAMAVAAGLTLMAAAHSGTGSVLSTSGRLIAVVLIFAYLGICWLMCSFVVGHFILPLRRE
jgi:hypothetical protein